MLTRFLTIRAKETGNKLYFHSKTIGKHQVNEAQLALNAIDSLCQQEKYSEALKEIIKIEEIYPESSKATKYYRGKIYENRLEPDGKKKKFSPSI